MSFLNLGILAHVDAGKTTLTERLLYTAGALDAVGSVDQGTTQTDSLALERQRGITIRAAVVSFVVGDVVVNLIDTPGHPDFIAEVDRSLAVLDGAVLVVSAVEGVQSQTVVLMRALRRLGVPTVLFVNKIDRSGADPERVLATVRERLSPDTVVMGTTEGVGGRSASFVPYRRDDPAFLAALTDTLVEHDEALLAALVDDRQAVDSPAALRSALAAQTAGGQVYPVFLGSATTGAGVATLMGELTALLPTASGEVEGPPVGAVFKVEREPGGQQVAYARLFSGSLHARQRLVLADQTEARVTSIRVFGPGAVVERPTVSAGQIAKLSGLKSIRVGDTFDTEPNGTQTVVHAARQHSDTFAPPTLETAVVPRDPAQRPALYSALTQLAEQDPLINLRQDDVRQELFLSLYGEIQKEVIHDTLAVDFGVEIEFRETTTLCIERVSGNGAAVELLVDDANPFVATVGLTIEPGRVGSGFVFNLTAELNSLPLFVYKNVDAFRLAMGGYVGSALTQGLFGWQVTDCVVTMTDCGYMAPTTTAADYRKLTPLVVMSALRRAGTVVCEPIQHFRVEAPADTLSAVLSLLSRHRAIPGAPSTTQGWSWVEGDVPAAEVQRLQQQLKGQTHGEGVLEVHFDRYEPGFGRPPVRPRSDDNPLNRKEYLLHVVRRA